MMKMKLNKKIAGATAMLMLSATMLGTSTFAWFTMNKEVTVSGLQLTAKADSTYLIVGPESSVTDLQAQNRTVYPFAPAVELQVFPSAHTNAVTNTSTCAVGNWFYKYADAPTSYAATENARSISGSMFTTDYVLHRTVYVTLAKGSEQASNLRCKSATFTMTNVKTGTAESCDAVTVLVTSPTAKDEEDQGSNFALTHTPLAATVTDSAAIPIDIWIYYNGEDESVFTNNVANLEGASIELVFEADYTPATN